MKVSFNTNAYTDKGNQYNRTSIGKKIGAAGLAAGTAILSVSRGSLKKESIQMASELLGSKGKYFAAMGLGIALWGAIGTGLGAIVDAVINKTRKNKADNTVQEAPQPVIEENK